MAGGGGAWRRTGNLGRTGDLPDSREDGARDLRGGLARTQGEGQCFARPFPEDAARRPRGLAGSGAGGSDAGAARGGPPVSTAAGGGSFGGREPSRGQATASAAAASAATVHATLPQRTRSRSRSRSGSSTRGIGRGARDTAPSLLSSSAAVAAPKPVYDLTLILDADAPSERRAEILREVEAFVERSGTIESKHDWGVRQLAYEIQHRKEAEYHLLQFTGPPELIERLRTMLRITDGVLRHRVIKVLPGTPPPPAMRAEPRPAAAAEPDAAAPEAPAPEAPAPEAPAPAEETPAEAPPAA